MDFSLGYQDQLRKLEATKVWPCFLLHGHLHSIGELQLSSKYLFINIEKNIGEHVSHERN
jgi:hypothetical protein